MMTMNKYIQENISRNSVGLKPIYGFINNRMLTEWFEFDFEYTWHKAETIFFKVIK